MEYQLDNESDDESTTTNRPKTPGITEYEKTLLLDLIEEKKAVIEDKRTAFAVHAKKLAAWRDIEKLFNSDGKTVRRSEAQLRKIWDNHKSKTKRAVSKYKKEVRRTGGGEKPKPLAPDVDRVAAMIPEQLKTLPNPFDSDAPLDVGEGTLAAGSVGEFLKRKDNSTMLNVESNSETVDSARQEDIISSANSVETDQTGRKKAGKASKDPRSMLVEYEAEEHKIRLINLNIQTKILQLEMSIKKRSLEMMEEEHSKKMKKLDTDVSAE